jgi:hypothetical protein
MIRLRIFIHRLRALFFKKRQERELEEEIGCHLEMQIEDNLRLGMSPDEARYEALRKFGGVEQIRLNRSKRSTETAAACRWWNLHYRICSMLHGCS